MVKNSQQKMFPKPKSALKMMGTTSNGCSASCAGEVLMIAPIGTYQSNARMSTSYCKKVSKAAAARRMAILIRPAKSLQARC